MVFCALFFWAFVIDYVCLFAIRAPTVLAFLDFIDSFDFFCFFGLFDFFDYNKAAVTMLDILTRRV